MSLLSQNYHMSLLEKTRLYKAKSAFAPGPSFYQPNYKCMDKKIDYKLKGRPKIERDNKNPGPGDYLIQSIFSRQLKKRRGFTMKSRPAEKQLISETPLVEINQHNTKKKTKVSTQYSLPQLFKETNTKKQQNNKVENQKQEQQLTCNQIVEPNVPQNDSTSDQNQKDCQLNDQQINSNKNESKEYCNETVNNEVK